MLFATAQRSRPALTQPSFGRHRAATSHALAWPLPHVPGMRAEALGSSALDRQAPNRIGSPDRARRV